MTLPLKILRELCWYFTHYDLWIVAEMQWRMAFTYGGVAGFYDHRNGNIVPFGDWYLTQPRLFPVPRC